MTSSSSTAELAPIIGASDRNTSTYPTDISRSGRYRSNTSMAIEYDTGEGTRLVVVVVVDYTMDLPA